jgi:hypothetical protein
MAANFRGPTLFRLRSRRASAPVKGFEVVGLSLTARAMDGHLASELLVRFFL